MTWKKIHIYHSLEEFIISSLIHHFELNSSLPFSRRFHLYHSLFIIAILSCLRSESGVVNLYKVDEAFDTSSAPKPVKEIMNLRTKVNLTLFNNDTQLMLIASAEKKNAMRLV